MKREPQLMFLCKARRHGWQRKETLSCAYRAGIGGLPVMPMRKGGCEIADEATMSTIRFWRYHRKPFYTDIKTVTHFLH